MFKSNQNQNKNLIILNLNLKVIKIQDLNHLCLHLNNKLKNKNNLRISKISKLTNNCKSKMKTKLNY